ncbi:organic hydroperoxide resistance protein [soil metagenome]
MDTLYKANAIASGEGRKGRSRTDDGKIDVTLSMPKGMGGDDGPGTNPEQLFATCYAACYLSALKLVSGQAKTPVGPDTQVHATVGIGPNTRGEGFNLDIALKVTGSGLDTAVIADLMNNAHQVCPYSNATRGNVDVALSAE